MRNRWAWNDPPSAPTEPSHDLHVHLGGHPLVAQILFQRGFTRADDAQAFLAPAHYPPTPPDDLPDLLQAVEILSHSIGEQLPILIWGDFDVDGQTATALLIDALGALGAQVAYYIPHRLKESHGINPDSLRQQVEELNPAVLLTCDTGVAASAAVDYAKSQGIVTLITDHHNLPAALPNADAIVNPKRLDPAHPLAALPGVGVAYKLIECLYTQHGRADELPRFLDLVALGIVADVAQQVRDTRYLLQLGMAQLRTTCRPGLQALIEVASVQQDRLNTTDIGFQLGPRLNAAGRLADARLGVELLTTHDSGRARLIAAQLDGLNNERRLQTRQITAAAQEQIARDPSLLNWEALILSHAAWHPGIIGIVAGQLTDRYQRPVILFSLGEDGTARGSARSVPGYDIGAAIAAQSDLLLQYGGHPGAAGLSLKIDNIPAFRRRLSDTLRDTFDPSVRPGLQLDAYLPLDAVDLALATELNRLAPFGEGNPRITLATRDLQLKSAAYIGRTQEHRRLVVEDADGVRKNVLWWNSADQPVPDGLFDLAYQLEISTYRDETELQLVLVDFRRSASTPPAAIHPQRQWHDYRQSPYPDTILQDITAQHPEAAIWAEGYRRVESPGLPLSELPTSDMLIVYTTPTGPQALHKALERVQPVHVALLGVDPPIRAMQDVLRRVLELVKYVLNQQDGHTGLDALAEAVGQSNETIRLVLDYYAARGEIMVDYRRGGSVRLAPGSGEPAGDALSKLDLLRASLNETAAYRAFFQRARAANLLGWEDEGS
ncbi:MAG: single-stranded-DNA-specific exonuclease RecJ [Anaerolineae bacterium]|nr:single-stranded-DNA-specific exonuclease RecJ [Anaerolineae bacterium]